MEKLIKIFSFIYSIGLKPTLFRFFYELLKKFGYFKIVNKKILRKNNGNIKYAFQTPIKLVNKSFVNENDYINKAENAINFKILSFNSQNLNFAPNAKMLWNYNPVIEKIAPNNVAWNSLPDFGPYGDIKIIWEASRFPHIFHFISAYSINKDKRFGVATKNTIIDWIEQNPFPFGVNYKCGQETSFRIISWIIALDYFSEFFDESDRNVIFNNIRISLDRIKANYSYASKWVKNNHSISEASGLLIGGLMFPQFKESNKYIKLGTKYLIKELSYQVFEDGAYIQHSFNYHRLVIDVLSFVILISERKGNLLPNYIYKQHLKLTHFLASFVMSDGTVPNYGANDGSIFFPFSDYRDYRESLNLASLVNEKTLLFDDKYSVCKFFGLDYKSAPIKQIEKQNFPISGYYHLFNSKFDIFIRCHNYETRPSHSDTLHIDLWCNGVNVFCDTGSFSYNTSLENKKHFSGIFGHNTVVIDNEDYMQSIFNFGKTNWPKGKVIAVNKDLFEGVNLGYVKTKGINHNRKVQLHDNFILVKDKISGINKPTTISQHWHTEFPIIELKNNRFNIKELKIESNIEGRIQKSKVSRFYNSYTETSQLVFFKTIETDFVIETKFTIEK